MSKHTRDGRRTTTHSIYLHGKLVGQVYGKFKTEQDCVDAWLTRQRSMYVDASIARDAYPDAQYTARVEPVTALDRWGG
jgi:hypothetical protein